MGGLTMKLLLLILIIGGSISCLEILASQKRRFEGKANDRKKSYLACEDEKRNHMNMMGKLREHENMLPSAASNQNVDANFRYNQMILRKLLTLNVQRPVCLQAVACGSTSLPGPHN
ncbi:hypothetical protein P3X46_012081 [Hevea brasiliensis]|uniref:Uncharacterized protein n=1 Tax=Hevea brasiliensis TaxID=3981 RepID=A0ABQ9M966_HEVBR|nr:hypothetical protein P3X46_012081 [Hevea brasiliensis]